VTYPTHRGVTGNVWTNGQPMLVNSIKECPFFVDQVDDPKGYLGSSNSKLHVPSNDVVNQDDSKILTVPVYLKNGSITEKIF
jgi:hypothetical protein